MANFITNQGQDNLKKRLVELVEKSRELKFLVGFFYFSGIRQLYQGLKNNQETILKVLVGLSVDKIGGNLVEYGRLQKDISEEEKINLFLDSVKQSINSEQFDQKEFYEQVKFFLRLIRENRLIIRKTAEPNHAKLYLFKLESGQVRPKLFITGSSNLTKLGLTSQDEFNVEIADFGFEEAEEYFDDLWEKATRITEYEDIKRKLIETIEQKTLVKEISPFEAFVLVLQTYLESFRHKRISDSLIEVFRKHNYIPYRYQLDAIKQALAIIEKNNGVILADVVGLGKTVIACAIARELRKRGVIICPPGLKGDPKTRDGGWNMYAEEFGLRLLGWEVWSLGELDKLQDTIRKMNDVEVVIIDEAHRFRNEDTQSYEYLKNICRGKIVILLTATPFNNRPADILSLLKLFTTPKKSALVIDENLDSKFRILNAEFEKLGYIEKYGNSPDASKRAKALNYYQRLFGEKEINLQAVRRRTRNLAKQIRSVIEPVTIRRNRLDLKNNPRYQNEVKNLSRVADPQEWFFDLSKKQSEFYDRILTYFVNPEEGGLFKGAIYRPFEYERGKFDPDSLKIEENREFHQQRNLYDFMRRLLVKRFESSFGAFYKSVENFRRTTKAALEFVKKTNKFILARKLMEDIYDKDVEEIDKELERYAQTLKKSKNLNPKKHKIYYLNKNFKLKKQFLADIESDLRLFDQILKELKLLKLLENDPKLAELVEKVKKILKQKSSCKEPKRKIVIFSEYTDTVNYLAPKLQKEFKNRVLVVAGDLSKKKVAAINRNFDASFPKQEDNYDILLTTDKLSEGFNLNRAGMVINYDIPWNPVRVIQRLGRINRISKKVFEELYLVNFFPTEKGASLVKSREIAANKMFLIHNVLGEDAKIFGPDEQPTPAKLYQRIQQNPEELEEVSFFTKVFKIYQKIKREHPEIIERLKKAPPRVKTAKKFKEDELLVFVKKGRLYVYWAKYTKDGKNKIKVSSLEGVFDRIKCSPNEKSLNWNTGQFWQAYEEVKVFKEIRQLPINEQSLEGKALNNLKYLLSQIPKREIKGLMPYLAFLRTLREDILDYGTLASYTLRRIKDFKIDSEEEVAATAQELEELKKRLGGENYLEKEKQKIKNLDKEIIVAVENKIQI